VDEVYDMVKIGRRDLDEPLIQVSDKKVHRPLSNRPGSLYTFLEDMIRVICNKDYSNLCMYLTEYKCAGLSGHMIQERLENRKMVALVSTGWELQGDFWGILAKRHTAVT